MNAPRTLLKALALSAAALIAIPSIPATAGPGSSTGGRYVVENGSDAPATNLIDSFGTPAQYDAIVRVGNCSGAIVAMPDSKASDPALILSNGHCVDVNMRDGVTVVDQPTRLKAYLHAGPTPQRIATLPVNRIVYATMTDTDLAIYQLPMSYESLYRSYKTVPRALADAAPELGDNLQVASGYWRRTWNCTYQGQADTVREAGWTWTDVTQMNGPGCTTQTGSSGSPVLNQAGKIVAVNNSGNFGRAAECSASNPCAIVDGRVVANPGMRYATQTNQLPGCFSNGHLTLNARTCELYGGAAYRGHLAR